MSSSENNDSISGNNDKEPQIDLSNPPLVGQCNSTTPIQILLFPPNNKRFRYDDATKSIEIEGPTETVGKVVLTKNDLNRFSEENSQYNSPARKSQITPLTTNFIPFSETPDLQTTSLLNSTSTSQVNSNIKEILKIEKVFTNSKLKKDCFLRGCKWSPDGLCLLSNSEDNVLRIFDTPEQLFSNPKNNLEPVLSMKEGGTIYDYEWYPLMNSMDPISCVFACTSMNCPIHLWDAYTGQLRATYQPINQFDEVTAAYSLAFSPDGSKLYSGFRKCLRIFDISQPGKVSEERKLKVKGSSVFQCHITSSICVNPQVPSLYALGCYDRTLGIYTEPQGNLLCVLKGHKGGITQIKFSSDGNYLFSGGRKDNEILCWDIRNPGQVVFSVERTVETQQKIFFDISKNQEYLITGTTNCYIKLFNIKMPCSGVLNPVEAWKGHDDCVNAVQFHPFFPIFASSSGQRHIVPLFFDENEDSNNKDDMIENSIKIWSYG